MFPLLLLGVAGVIGAVMLGRKSASNAVAPHLRNPPDGRVPPGWSDYERFCDAHECGWAYYYMTPGNPHTVLFPDKGPVEIVKM